VVFNPATGAVAARVGFGQCCRVNAPSPRRRRLPFLGRYVADQACAADDRFLALMNSTRTNFAHAIKTLEHGTIFSEDRARSTARSRVIEFSCGLPQL